MSLDDCGDHPLVRAYLDAVERQRGLRRGSNAKGKLVTRRAATGDCTHLERGPGHRRRTSSGAAALGFCSHGGSYQRLERKSRQRGTLENARSKDGPPPRAASPGVLHPSWCAGQEERDRLHLGQVIEDGFADQLPEAGALGQSHCKKRDCFGPCATTNSLQPKHLSIVPVPVTFPSGQVGWRA